MKDKVFEYLTDNGPCGPTQIGLFFGYPYQTASSSIMPYLNKLLQSKRVEKIKVNGRVKYKAL